MGAGNLRVLVVAFAFPPAAAIGSLRPLRLVRRLADDSVPTAVLMGSPHTYRATMPMDDTMLERVPAAVRVVRAPVVRVGRDGRVGRHSSRDARKRPPIDAGVKPTISAGRIANTVKSLVRRPYQVLDDLTSIPDREVGWVVPAFVVGLVTVARFRPTVLFSTAPPWSSQVVALLLATVTRLPWIADFRDPWARAPWRETWPTFTRRAVAVLERFVIGKADAVLFATKTNRAEYAAHYGPALARKFHVVANGCDPDEFVTAMERAPRGGPFVVLHAGSLYGARSPVPLFRAVARMLRTGLIRPQDLRLRFIGGSTKGDAFEEAAAAEGLEGVVEFLPRMPRREIVSEMARASCLLVLQPGTTMSIPGKLYEYFAVGKPVLAVAEEGELADLVRESGIGLSVRPDDEFGMMSALQQFMQSNADAVPRVAAHLYDGNRTAADVATIIRTVAAGGPHAGPSSSLAQKPIAGNRNDIS